VTSIDLSQYTRYGGIIIKQVNPSVGQSVSPMAWTGLKPLILDESARTFDLTHFNMRFFVRVQAYVNEYVLIKILK